MGQVFRGITKQGNPQVMIQHHIGGLPPIPNGCPEANLGDSSPRRTQEEIHTAVR